MQDMLDRIKERNFGRKIHLTGYVGDKPEDLNLLKSGTGVYSLFVDGLDMNISIYDFNIGRKDEVDSNGKYDDIKELDRIITEIIRVKFN